MLLQGRFGVILGLGLYKAKATHQLGSIQKLDKCEIRLWSINLNNGFTYIQFTWKVFSVTYVSLLVTVSYSNLTSSPGAPLIETLQGGGSNILCLWNRAHKTQGRCLTQPRLSEQILTLRKAFFALFIRQLHYLFGGCHCL